MKFCSRQYHPASQAIVLFPPRLAVTLVTLESAQEELCNLTNLLAQTPFQTIFLGMQD